MTCPKCGKRNKDVVRTIEVGNAEVVRHRRCLDCGTWRTREFLVPRSFTPATGSPSVARPQPTGSLPVARRYPIPHLGGLGGLPLGVSSISSSSGEERASSKPSDARAMRAEPARFAEFWAAYPRHVARIKAVEIWVKRELDQQADVIIGAIQIQRAEFLEREPDKVPHAATWLNQERWKDEVDRRPRPVGRPAKSDGNIGALNDFLARGNG